MMQFFTKSGEPGMGRLLKTVDCFLKLAHIIRYVGIFKTSGWLMYTSSCRNSWRNALLMSTWQRCHLRETARDRISLTVTGFTTGLNVSWQSIPYRWVKPQATKHALCLSMEPSGCCLTLKIHLQPTIFTPCGLGTRTNVLFAWRASYYVFISSYQARSDRACLWEVGSSEKCPSVWIVHNGAIIIMFRKHFT